MEVNSCITFGRDEQRKDKSDNETKRITSKLYYIIEYYFIMDSHYSLAISSKINSKKILLFLYLLYISISEPG